MRPFRISPGDAPMVKESFARRGANCAAKVTAGAVLKLAQNDAKSCATLQPIVNDDPS